MHPNDTTLTPCDHCGSLFKPRDQRSRFCCRACYRAGAATPALERMQRYIDKSGGEDACWNWTGKSAHEFGYGITSESKTGRNLYAHRVMYESVFGPIPGDLWVLHRCDNSRCCNPRHLFLGTHDDNMADMRAKGRNAPGEKRWNAMLNCEIVGRIRSMKGTMSHQKIADIFGVSDATIDNVMARKSWRHCP